MGASWAARRTRFAWSRLRRGSSAFSAQAQRDFRQVVVLREMREDDEGGAAVVIGGEKFGQLSLERCPVRDMTRCFTAQG